PTKTPSKTPTPTPLKPSVHQVSKLISLAGSGVEKILIYCPTGELSLSGGWVGSSSATTEVERSQRSGQDAWSLYVSHSGSASVIAYVECLRQAPTGTNILEIEAVGNIPGGVGASSSAVFAFCPTTTYLVGGGFLTGTGTRVRESRPTDPNPWSAR